MAKTIWRKTLSLRGKDAIIIIKSIVQSIVILCQIHKIAVGIAGVRRLLYVEKDKNNKFSGRGIGFDKAIRCKQEKNFQIRGFSLNQPREVVIIECGHGKPAADAGSYIIINLCVNSSEENVL